MKVWLEDDFAPDFRAVSGWIFSLVPSWFSVGVFDCFLWCSLIFIWFRKTTQWKSQVFCGSFSRPRWLQPLDLSEASEADAEAKRLAGVGMANMRSAMAQGFQAAPVFFVGGKDSVGGKDGWVESKRMDLGVSVFFCLEGWWMFILILRWKLVICFQGFVLERINNLKLQWIYIHIMQVNSRKIILQASTSSIKHWNNHNNLRSYLFAPPSGFMEIVELNPTRRPWD